MLDVTIRLFVGSPFAVYIFFLLFYFKVTQDELEDATRDLESRENQMKQMKSDLDHVVKERSRLVKLMNMLKQNEDRLVADVIADNEKLADEISPKPAEIIYLQQTESGSGSPDLTALIGKLRERDAALNIMRTMRDQTETENDELKRRIDYLERKLKEMTNQRDKLKKEAEYRAGYMNYARDEYGTIHMLRDDLKRIAKENADLKHDVVLKQRQMYDMSKDLHKMRIKIDVESKSSEKTPKREDTVEKLINELASTKADRFIIDTKLKDAERRLNESAGKAKNGDEEAATAEAHSIANVLKRKLVEKEKEIEKLKRTQSRSPSPTKSPLVPQAAPRDDTMSDVLSAFDSSRSDKEERRGQLELRKKLEELREENMALQQTVADHGLRSSADYVKKIKTSEKKIAQQRVEITALNDDNEQKRKRIRELLTAIEEIKDGRPTSQKSNKKMNELINKTKEDEMQSVLEKLRKSKGEVNEWKSKAENYQRELDKRDNKRDKRDRGSGGQNTVELQETIMDQKPPVFDDDEDEMLMHGDNMILPQAPGASSSLLHEPMYVDMEQQEGHINIYEVPLEAKQQQNRQSTSLVKENNTEATSSKKTESTTKKISVSRIPVSPVKRNSGKLKVVSDSGATTTTGGTEKEKDETQVRSLKILLTQATDELDVYRTNLNMNEHDTLETLGHERLNYVIDFQISTRCMTELRTIKNDVYELEHENELLQTNYVNLAESMSDFNDDIQSKMRPTKSGEVASQKVYVASQKVYVASENSSSELSSKIEQQQLELEEVTRHLAELNEHISTQNKATEELEILLEDTEKDLLKSKETEGKQERKIKGLENKVKLQEQTNSEIMKERQEFSEQLKTKTEECNRLKKKMNAQNAAGKTDIGGRNKQLQEAKKLKEELAKKCTECESISKDLKKKSEECVKLQRKTTPKTTSSSSNAVEKNRELKRVKEELLEKTKELQDISGQLQEKIQEVNKLKKELQQKDVKLSDESTNKEEELLTIQNLREQLTESRAEVQRRDTEIDNKDDLLLTIQNLREQLAESRSEIQKRNDDTDTSEVEEQVMIQKLREQLAESRSESNAEIQRRDADIETFKKENQDMIQHMREQLAESSAEIQKRNLIIQELRSHIDKIKQQEAAWRAEATDNIELVEKEYQTKIGKLEKSLLSKDKESEIYLDETVKAMEDAKERLIIEINTRKRLDEEMKALREKTGISKQREDILMRELNEYKRAATEKQHELVEPQQLIELAEALEASETHARNIEEKLGRCEEENARLRKSLNESEADMKVFVEKLNIIERTSETHDDLEQHIEQLERALEESEESVRLLSETVKKHEDSMELERNKNKQYTMQLQETLRESVARVEELANKLEKQEKTEEQVAKLENLLQTSNEHAQSAEMNLKELELEMDKYREEETELREHIREQDELLQASEKHAQSLKTVNEMETQVQSLQELSQSSEKKIEEMTGELKTKTETLQRERDDTAELKKSLEVELGRLRRMGNEFESYKNAAESEIAHMTAEMQTMSKKIGWLEAEKKKVPPPKMPSIEEEIIEVETVHDSMAVPYNPADEDLTVELEILQGCNEDLEQEIDELKSKIVTLEEENRTVNEELKRTKTELVQHQSVSGDLQTDEEDSTVTVSNLESVDEESTKELERTREDLRKTLEYLGDLNEKNNALERDRETALLNFQKEQVRTKQLEAQIKELPELLQRDDRYKQLEAENRNRASMIEQLEEVVDQLENENVRKDEAFEKLRTNNENNIKELRNVMTELKEENRVRSDENQAINDNRHQLKHVIEEQDHQIKVLRAELKQRMDAQENEKEKDEIDNSRSSGNSEVEVEKLYFEVDRLQQELEQRIERERELELIIDSWIQKSNVQSMELNRLHDELKQKTTTSNAVTPAMTALSIKRQASNAKHLTRQMENLKKEIKLKGDTVQSLQQELRMKDEQHQKALLSLNKRREESKRFLAMQQTLRDEIDSKEDLIRKLNFKLKAHDLDITASSLNVSRDDDLDQSGDSMNLDSTNENAVDKAIVMKDVTEEEEGEGDTAQQISKQLRSARDRNKCLSRELESCRSKYIEIKEDKLQLEVVNEALTEDARIYKERITDLRNMIQTSPDTPASEDDPNFVGLRTKLYASYKELRENSIEIASLRMCIDIKDDELTNLREEVEQLRVLNKTLQEAAEITRTETNERSDNLDCSHSDDVKTLVRELNNREQIEQELQNQITELRQRLVDKSKQSDRLQIELSKVTTRFRDIEQKLCQDDRDLREKFLHVFENDTSEISEVTPLNSMKLFSAQVGANTDDETSLTEDDDNDNHEETFNETFTLDEQADNTEAYRKLKDLQLKTEEENLFQREQIKCMREEIDRINVVNKTTNEKLEYENDNLQRLLSQLQHQLRQLETTKNDGE